MSPYLNRRSVLVGSLALAGSATLAACGNNTGSAEGGNPSDPASSTLKVWAWDPAFNIYALKEAEKIYQQSHPEFSLEISEMGWGDVEQKLTTLAQAQDIDQLPDIFLMVNMAAQKNIEGYPDIFANMEKSGIDFSEFPESVVNYSTWEGTHYGLPFDSGTSIAAWRTDFLEQAGYTIADLTDITWSRFIEIGKKIKEATGKPMLSSQAGASILIMQMIQSAGSSLFTDSGEVNIAGNKVLLKAAEIYKQLVDEGLLVEVNSWDEYVASFTREQVVGTINGVWVSGSIQTAEDQAGKWAATNLPSIDDVNGATNYSANGGSSWYISANANYELAADFLASTFAGSTELYDTILPSSGAVANWIPAGNSPVYNEPVEFFGGQKVYADVVEFSTKVPSINTGAYYYEGRDAVSAALTQIVGGADPAEALKAAEETTAFAMS